MNSSEPSAVTAISSALADPQSGSLTTVRGLVAQATQQLLGDTIAVTDRAWRSPSRLPGWNRAHVGTHLARQADGLLRLVDGARMQQQREMYSSLTQRETEVEAGAARNGLELQIDLDTSAGQLADGFDRLDDVSAWDTVVELRGGIQVPARMLPLARLTEVVLHHVDLDVGFEVAGIDGPTAEWLLEWCAFRLRTREEFPALQLVSTSGFTVTVGRSGAGRRVEGSSAQLLGWLTSRTDGRLVTGVDDLVLAPF